MWEGLGHWDKTMHSSSDDSVPFTAANVDTSTTALYINSSSAVSEMWAGEEPILYKILYSVELMYRILKVE